MLYIVRKNLEKSPIVPDTIIFEKKIFTIISIASEFIIKKYELFLDNHVLLKVKLIAAEHPNCNPKDKLFCLPEGMKNSVLTKEIYESLNCMLRTFNLDNCYFMPWNRCKFVRRYSS